ncbi:glycine-rich cell wall structural protein 1-like [Haliotis rufescens]|uniref:glycine-rich cell wall structural protein 1-like n=1 Tax=Haliotis rufescens TaxID=6454 RepID=UPI00201F279B|nr:glycine-rich cell wall structural protein 1-like [Haliotis rufescens]
MAFLTVAILSVIAHLTFGQGMGQMSNAGFGFGNAGSSWGQAGAGFGQAGAGLGQAGGSWGQAGAGLGQAGAGFGQAGASWGQAGAGLGQLGAGLGQLGAGLGQAGAGFGQAGAGFGQAGAGFGQAGLGLGLPGFGRPGAGWGQIGGVLGQNTINPFFNTTITCTFSATGITGSLTLRRSQPSWGGWGLGQSRGGLTGSAVLRTSTVSGTYNLVITERSRVEAGCTADGLGPVLGSNVWGQQWGQGLRQQWGQPWGQQWGQGLGQSWGTGTTTTPGVVTSVTLSTNQETIIDLASANLPFRQIERFGGRGMALCTSLTTGTDGRQVCVEPILACCKLGFDNQDAVTPAAP